MYLYLYLTLYPWRIRSESSGRGDESRPGTLRRDFHGPHDASDGKTARLPALKNILIHCAASDWTRGCPAVANHGL